MAAEFGPARPKTNTPSPEEQGERTTSKKEDTLRNGVSRRLNGTSKVKTYVNWGEWPAPE